MIRPSTLRRPKQHFRDPIRLLRPGTGKHVNGRYVGADKATAKSMVLTIASLRAGDYAVTVDGQTGTVTFADEPHRIELVASAVAAAVIGAQAIDLGGGRIQIVSTVDVVVQVSEGLQISGVHIDTVASVQPARPSELQNLPKGRRRTGAVKFYTDTPVQSLEEFGPNQSDELEYNDERYEVQQAWLYDMGTINHTKAVATLLDNRNDTLHQMSLLDDFEDASWDAPLTIDLSDDFEDAAWVPTLADNVNDDFEDVAWAPTLADGINDDFEQDAWV